MNLLLKIGGHRRSTIRGSSAFRKGCTANGQTRLLMLIVDVDHQITDAMEKDGLDFSVQVDKCSQLLESTLALYSEAGQTAGQVKSNLNGTSL